MMRTKLIIAAFMLTFVVGWTVPSFAEGERGLEPIKIELPEPFFGGMPIDGYCGPNVEEEDFKDRAPYLAPKGTVIVSKDKKVTSSCKEPLLGDLKQITDGDKDYAKGSLVELESGVQWVQIDLEQEYDIYAVLVWHFHQGKSIYFDVIVKISNDSEFKEAEEIYNSDHDNSAGLGVGKDKDYFENNKGRLIKTPDGVRGRYVRLYSNGNIFDAMNHYVEVEVFGKPVK